MTRIQNQLLSKISLRASILGCLMGRALTLFVRQEIIARVERDREIVGEGLRIVMMMMIAEACKYDEMLSDVRTACWDPLRYTCTKLTPLALAR
jgi:hypothetical protein